MVPCCCHCGRQCGLTPWGRRWYCRAHDPRRKIPAGYRHIQQCLYEARAIMFGRGR